MTPEEILSKYWNYDSFRPLQREIINAAIENKDVLALMPTGGGKSVCFQIAGLAREGVTLVFSPLISLMQDQVARLKKVGLRAQLLYSGQHHKEADRILDNAVYGGLDFLYIAPERLHSQLFQERLKQMNIALIAVDEAHCISMWGHEFRPSYRKIHEIRDQFPDIPIMALTATATEKTMLDIQEQLAFKKEQAVFKKSFARPNLTFAIRYDLPKERALYEVLKRVKGSAIVYVNNRKLTVKLANFLNKVNISAAFYHAGLDHTTRKEKQQRWMNDQVRVMVATSAFGMGIDKADVRIVVHWGMSASPEAYYQEAGRAGRDGKKAYAILLHDPDLAGRMKEKINERYPERKEIQKAYGAICNHYALAVGSGQEAAFDWELEKIAAKSGLSAKSLHYALEILKYDEYFELSEGLFQRARIQILVSYEKMYDQMLRKKELMKLLKLIIRSLEGAFEQEIAFDIGKMANHLGVSVYQLEQKMTYLAQEGLIRYIPKKEMPQLVFLRPRLRLDDLLINQKRIYQLRDEALEKLEAMNAYISKSVCREAFLRAYFSDDAEACGRCDVCIGRYTEPSKVDGNIVQEELSKYLNKSESATLDEIMDATQLPKEQLVQALQKLYDEGSVIKDGFSWSKK